MEDSVGVPGQFDQGWRVAVIGVEQSKLGGERRSLQTSKRVPSLLIKRPGARGPGDDFQGARLLNQTVREIEFGPPPLVNGCLLRVGSALASLLLSLQSRQVYDLGEPRKQRLPGDQHDDKNK